MAGAPVRRRRTQAERRAGTRTALLDATIEALIKHGYAGLTTNEIVRVAGVTRGAQAHHFTSKADLLVQALDHLTQKMTEEVEQSLAPTLSEGTDNVEVLIDRLWEFYCGPLFTAAIELMVAGRTDLDIRTHLRRFDRELNANIRLLGARYIPNLALAEGSSGIFITVLATMRGLAMLRFTASEDGVERMWASARLELLESLRRLGESQQAPTG
jgi:AcrR family transcriptional regulator